MKKIASIVTGLSLVGAGAFAQGEYNTGISVEDGVAKVGQNYDLVGDGFNQTYDPAGTKVAETVGSFGNFGGGLHVNWSAAGLFIGMSGGNTGGGNNFMIFLDVVNASGVAALTGLGDSTGASLNTTDWNHLDQSENLAFGLRSDGVTAFRPEIAILAGDEWGDQDTFSSFGRPGMGMFGGGNDSGQGIVDLTAGGAGVAFAGIAGSDLTQFDSNPQNGDDFDANQDVDNFEAFIPAAFLTGLGFSLANGSTLEIAAIVAGGDAGNPTPTTFFSTTFVGSGAAPAGTGGANTLNSAGVTLSGAPVPEPNTFALLGLSMLGFAAFRRKMAR